jgi:hypothetical protein
MAALAIFAIPAVPAQAVGIPALSVKTFWGDTHMGAPGAGPLGEELPAGKGEFYLHVRNAGPGAPSAPVVIEDHFPAAVTITAIDWHAWYRDGVDAPPLEFCAGVGTSTLHCELPSAEAAQLLPAMGVRGVVGVSPGLSPSGFAPPIYVDVDVDPEAGGAEANTATVSGGGSASFTDTNQIEFDPTPAGFGLLPDSFEAELYDAAFPFGSKVRQAGATPFEMRVNFDLNQEAGFYKCLGGPPACHGFAVDNRYTAPVGSIRTADVTLARAMIGNPESTPKCDPVDFVDEGSSNNSTGCPANTQIGYIDGWYEQRSNEAHGESALLNTNGALLSPVALYNLEPPKGVPADIAFNAGGYVQGHIYPSLDAAQDYAIKFESPDISNLLAVRGAQVTTWGVPGDPTHNKFRFFPQPQAVGEVHDVAGGAPFEGSSIRPLLTNPTDCGFENGGALIRIDSYQHPGQFTPTEEYSDPLNVSGCGDPRFRFEPKIALQPTSRDAGGPTGLTVHLEVPQRNQEVKDANELYAQSGDVQAIATPPIKKAVVTLPEGMTLSPSSAQGLESCSPAQIGLVSKSPIRFNNAPVSCPDASQFGTLTLHTPVFPASAQPEGWIYIAKQNDNPFGNFISLYLVIQEPLRGILIKVPGRLDLDPATGQIKTTFDDLPQFPVSDLQMNFKGGVRAGLVNPTTCGTKTIDAEFFSWQDPTTAHPVANHYDITHKADGSPCVDSLAHRPFSPGFTAGTLSPAAGSYSPFLFRLTRTDDDQEFSQLGVTLPAGLAAKFAGVGRCSDAAIAAAEAPGRSGIEEQIAPSCPASSLIGTTEVGSGVGVPLTFIPGKVYLAGPYKGAPLSIVAITAVQAGPFDLGVIAVRTTLRINSETAQGSALTDPFPQIFEGIPVRIRDIRLALDRTNFTLNPTNCTEKRISAHITGTGGDLASTADDSAADLADRFQAADCARLGFSPKLSFHLRGGTKRGDHPALRADVAMPGGGANIGRASVALPKTEFLDQGHIKTVCTRVQFAAKQCPPGSVYGQVVAKTPLFDERLEGPVYLRSSSNLLPDLVGVLSGPASLPLEIDLVGRIDSINGGIRNTFDVVPDAPVDTFTLTMQGGKKGLLVNSANLCAHTSRAIAEFSAQNGKQLTLKPKMQNSCPKQRKRSHRRHR